jgi:carbon starvation protein
MGFLSHAHSLGAAIDAGALPAGITTVAAAHRMMFNDYLDAAVAAFFMVSVVVILADSLRIWYAVASGRVPAKSSEVPYEARVAEA